MCGALRLWSLPRTDPSAGQAGRNSVSVRRGLAWLGRVGTMHVLYQPLPAGLKVGGGPVRQCVWAGRQAIMTQAGRYGQIN